MGAEGEIAADLERVGSVARAAGGCLGLLGLVAWLTGHIELAQFVPQGATMKFNTALGLLLLGGGGRLGAWGAVAVGGLTLFEIATGVGLGIDQLCFRDVYTLGTQPGRMSLVAATCFVLLGGAALARSAWRQQMAGLVATCLAGVAFIGYAFGEPAFYRPGPWTSLALPTSLALMLLGVGAIVARPLEGWVSFITRDSTAAAMTRRLLPVLLFVSPALAWLRLQGQEIGLYDTRFGLALLTTVQMAGFSTLLWWVATRMHREESRRRRSDKAQHLTDAALRSSEDARAEEVRVRELVEAELRSTEQQLRQAQKMDAFGTLAAGVAHDFNNLLSVILSYGGMLLEEYRPNDPRRSDLNEIVRAGERAASLTRQLLAFSRQQVLHPQSVDVNDLIHHCSQMLRRLIGEDIELVFLPFAALGKTRVDPGQIEQVILNLVVNARDAMPQGGELVLETGNVELDADYAAVHLDVTPGHYVMFSVSDTGGGMDEATRSRIFEPFFTTKEVGKGTGLGLSTVFGIVRQSGGNIWVYSEEGKGTIFKIYLPRDDVAAPVSAGFTAPADLTGTETVLLVEDDEQVRQLASRILGRSGYTVLAASGAEEARTLAADRPVDLLLTDVVMPRMSGRQLAAELVSDRPELRVVYMSGYTDDTVIRHGVLEPGASLVQKPLLPAVLLARVHEALRAR